MGFQNPYGEPGEGVVLWILVSVFLTLSFGFGFLVAWLVMR